MAVRNHEVLGQDSSQEELLVLCPDKDRDKNLRFRLPSAPVATGKYADH